MLIPAPIACGVAGIGLGIALALAGALQSLSEYTMIPPAIATMRNTRKIPSTCGFDPDFVLPSASLSEVISQGIAWGTFRPGKIFALRQGIFNRRHTD